MIDIVVMYCNDKDKKWQESFEYYKELEINNKKTSAKNRQAFGEERYREWDALKYWFRGVENNCLWLRKVFLILSEESQIPEWLDTSNPKLRIVYHKEFIPANLLPTFNASTIELYLSNIEDLSDNYIFCNDDYYFLNKVEETSFIKNGLLVYGTKPTPFHYFSKDLYKNSDGAFYRCLNNCLKLQVDVTRNDKTMFPFSHLPYIRNKNFEKKILNTYSDLINKAQEKSKFRKGINYTAYMFECLYRSLNEHLEEPIYSNSKYITLKSTVDFDSCHDYQMVCFNDTEQLDNFDVTKYKLLKFFNQHFPYKSSFEKEIINDNIIVSVIIPVQNQEKLLKRCIDSIPKLKGVEIIVIDDGSTDNTADVIGSYTCAYPEFVGGIICKTAHGVSNARNLGIEKARGSYIIFIDSDDYIEGDIFKYIMDSYVIQDKYDMIFYDMIDNDNDVFKVTKGNIKYRCGCFKFIRKTFLGKERFPLNVQYGEDRLLHNELIAKNPKCKFTNKVMYHYNFPREGSLCHRHDHEGGNND